MFKKIWLTSLLFIAILGSAFANGPLQDSLPSRVRLDTIDIEQKDSLAIIAASIPTLTRDSKQAFKDLYIRETLSTGISIDQLNPLAIGFVQDYMGKFGKSMDELKDWGRPYFDVMDVILEQYGLPKELKYLAVEESRLKTQARSGAGAVGPWQFMASTARNMGLKVNNKIDERRDLYKSTHAACKYLNNLFDIYGDWLLVIAAYNGGPGKVNSAMKRSGSVDFWSLQNFLPLESRNHVKKFIAIHFMMEGEGGVTTLTKLETGNRLSTLASNNGIESTDSLSIQAINGRYNSSILARHIAIEITQFLRMNPNFDKLIATNGQYQLRLPPPKMDVFLSKKTIILEESMQLLLNPETAAAR